MSKQLDPKHLFIWSQ